MKAVVTGGLGFIGSTLAWRLAREGADVILVDSLVPEYGGNLYNVRDIPRNVSINLSDIRDQYSIRAILDGADVVFNLAGQTSHADSMKDPYTDLDINARSQLSLLEAVRDVCPAAHVIYASTRQVYGRPQGLPVSEDHPAKPVDINGINKLAGEQYHMLYHTVYGIKTTVLRLTNTYGPRMRIKDARQTFVGIWIKNLLVNQPILVYGNGRQLRDFTFVDDVVEAFLLCMSSEFSVGQILNLGGSEVIGLIDLAKMFCSVHGGGCFKLVEFPSERKAIDIGDYYSDFSKAKHILGWKPTISLEEGLRLSLDYFKSSLPEYL